EAEALEEHDVRADVGGEHVRHDLLLDVVGAVDREGALLVVERETGGGPDRSSQIKGGEHEPRGVSLRGLESIDRKAFRALRGGIGFVERRSNERTNEKEGAYARTRFPHRPRVLGAGERLPKTTAQGDWLRRS